VSHVGTRGNVFAPGPDGSSRLLRAASRVQPPEGPSTKRIQARLLKHLLEGRGARLGGKWWRGHLEEGDEAASKAARRRSRSSAQVNVTLQREFVTKSSSNEGPAGARRRHAEDCRGHAEGRRLPGDPRDKGPARRTLSANTAHAVGGLVPVLGSSGIHTVLCAAHRRQDQGRVRWAGARTQGCRSFGLCSGLQDGRLNSRTGDTVLGLVGAKLVRVFAEEEEPAPPWSRCSSRR